MERRCLRPLIALFLAASILTPQIDAQDGIRFEMPKGETKKKGAKPVVAPNPATVEVLNSQSAMV